MMTGGTSIPISDHTYANSIFSYWALRPGTTDVWDFVTAFNSETEGATTNFYYKINGRNGDNSFIISAGVYVDIPIELPWQVVTGMDFVPDKVDYRVHRSTTISIKDNNSSQYHDITFSNADFFGNDYFEYSGTLLNYEVRELPYDASLGTRYGCKATYRFWLCNNFDFLLEAAAKLTVTQRISLNSSNIGAFYGEYVYLHFDNVPYITCPTEIDDVNLFYIEYSFPNLSKIESIQFTLLDNYDNPIIDYKDVPKTSNRYTFALLEEDLDKLYAKFNTVNDATVYFGIKYKNKNESPMTISYPMHFIITPHYPTVDVGLSDNKKIVNADEVFVKSLSELKVALNPVAYKGASITYTAIMYGGEDAVNTNEALFDVTDVRQIHVYCKDSRGLDVSKTLVMDSWVPYMFPTCSITAEAPNTDGYLPISISGTYFDKYYTAFTNSFNIYYKYTSSNPDNSVTEWTQLLPRPALTIDDIYHYTGSFELLVPNHADTYTIQLQFSDRYSTYTSNTITVKATPVFDWGQGDFNFNVPVSIQGDLVVTGQIVNAQMAAAIEDSIPMDFIVEQGTVTTGSGNSAANWVYRKWNSGVAECWCRKHVSTAVNTAWGNLFVSGALSYTNITWGVNFIDIPVANITIAPNASGAFLIAGGSTSLTKTNTGGYEIARGSALASAGNFYINYYGIGKWK